MNRLRHRAEFTEILSGYQVSESVMEVLRGLRLVLLSGPSASGRNTIINELLKSGHYAYIVSDTTRQPRINNGIRETNGVEYWFRDEEQFLDELRHGDFLEAEIIHGQQVSGISLRELNRVSSSGKIAINEVEIGGFANILCLKPDAVGVFVLPPSFKVWMERLRLRGSMPEFEILNRLATGVRVLRQADLMAGTHIVVNDRLDEAVRAVDLLAHGQSVKGETAADDLVRTLLEETITYLHWHNYSGTLDV